MHTRREALAVLLIPSVLICLVIGGFKLCSSNFCPVRSGQHGVLSVVMNLWGFHRRFPWLEYRHALVMRLPAGARLLEVGASNGDRAKRFKALRPDIQVDATDILDFSASMGPDISFFQADLTRGLPAELSGQYDCVTSMHLFEHLPPGSYETAIREIKKVLKPGGSWYIETPGIRSLWFPSLKIGRKGPHCPINFYDDPSHIKPFSEMGLYYMLDDAGFTVTKTGIARNWLYAFLSPVLLVGGLLTQRRLWVAMALIHLFGWSVYAHGVKPHVAAR